MSKFAAVLLLAFSAFGTAQGQSKVAIINSQKAVLDTAEIKKAQAELEVKFKPRQDQALKLQKELQDIQAQLQGGKLNQAAEQDLTAQGQRKQRELQRIQEDLQADVDRERQDILQRTGQRMQDVVKKLADEKGLDVVIDSSNTVFFKPALDLTAEASAAYDKAYPVK
jgi:outer membrane protein